MPKSPLRVSIGRVYEWYKAIGEFESVGELLEMNSVCIRCGRARYCEWTATSTLRLPAETREERL